MPTGRPRVLWVGAFPPPGSEIAGGAVTSCRLLLASSFATRADLVLLDSTQISNPPPGVAMRALLAARRLIAYVVRFEESRPDAVLLFAAAGPSVAEKGLMAWYARLRRTAALLFPRGGPTMAEARRSPQAARLVRLAFRGADVLLCQGPAWQRFAAEMGVAPERTAVVPNWTATPEMLAVGHARRPRAPSARVRLLYVGWVNREKGAFDLLEAARILSVSHDFELEIVGEGVGSHAFRTAIAEAGLESVVHMRGWQRGEALRRAYEAADVFVLASWAEGFPNALVEAMAAGLAPVVTAVGAIPDLLTPELDALIVPAHQPERLAAALGRVIKDPELRARLGEHAALSAAREFSVEPAVDRLLRAIERAVASAGTAAGRLHAEPGMDRP